jgi:hypothetical protein
MNFYSLFLLIGIAVFICFSCKTNKSPTTREAIKLEIEKEIDESDFRTYYIEFRKSLMENDKNKLIKLSLFPLDVWGFEDQDPKTRINQEDFIVKLNESVSFGVDYDVLNNESISTLDLFKMNESIDKINTIQNGDTLISVGLLDFAKIDKSWKLIRIYTDTKESK